MVPLFLVVCINPFNVRPKSPKRILPSAEMNILSGFTSPCVYSREWSILRWVNKDLTIINNSTVRYFYRKQSYNFFCYPFVWLNFHTIDKWNKTQRWNGQLVNQKLSQMNVFHSVRLRHCTNSVGFERKIGLEVQAYF